MGSSSTSVGGALRSAWSARIDSGAPAARSARIDEVEMLPEDDGGASFLNDDGPRDGGGNREGRTGLTAEMTLSTMRSV